MRILLIEDDKVISRNIKVALARSHIDADIASSYEDGLFMAESETYDVLVVDWSLPDGEGSYLVKKLREQSVSVPILMLTARSQIEDKVTGLNVGADDYMTKPFAMIELVARINSLIRRSTAAESSPIVQVKDISLNINTCEVTVKGNVIELTPKEYALLEYLALHPNEVFSRDDLLFHVWGEYADTLSNTVDVHIRYLRQKIHDTPAIPLIKTIKNKGYMLCHNSPQNKN